ncbi:universal stress protein [Telluribacter sp.]|jgi:nucleotide-binding universal stress UspA family protein|uniref:universal stress protein n=1 Tax=Telluribacter sp. TaxID=1978767 RepID=UPI002E0E6AC6|nr:universal stress protein [Telluribacter sp.]
MQAILVPTDFSTNSQKALEIAAGLAVQANAELVLLNVGDNVTNTSPIQEFVTFDQNSRGGLTQNARDYMVELRRELMENPAFVPLKIRAEFYKGSLVPIIENYAEQYNIDLIVMGTRGASGLEELLIGSNTEKVIRRACCPVLAVPQEAKTGKITSVVFPSTLKDNQKVVFRRMAAIQKTLGTGIQVQVLYINDPAGLGSEEAIQQRFRELISDSQLLNTTFHLKGALDLDEGVEILRFAKEQQADIIAMGTHQRRGLSHLLLGSMTEDTVNHSEIPVLTIPIR